MARALLFASFLSLASAQAIGFNWAAQGNDRSAFEAGFRAQASLPGAPEFTSARLYTMIEDGTTDEPISAIQAALSTNTTLLLGLWASAGEEVFSNELTALRSAISQYGSEFANAVVGISVGSEDLYRDTYLSQVINGDPNPGAAPDTIVDYIRQVRRVIRGTVLADKLVGHVDAFDAFLNDTSRSVIEASDFIGLDVYPYYQSNLTNDINSARDLFFNDYKQIQEVAGKKPVWVTETGWPTSGDDSHLAVADVNNARIFWREVGCALFGKTNVWWFTLADDADPSFGILGDSVDNQPLFDLSCDSDVGVNGTLVSDSGSGMVDTKPGIMLMVVFGTPRVPSGMIHIHLGCVFQSESFGGSLLCQSVTCTRTRKTQLDPFRFVICGR